MTARVWSIRRHLVHQRTKTSVSPRCTLSAAFAIFVHRRSFVKKKEERTKKHKHHLFTRPHLAGKPSVDGIRVFHLQVPTDLGLPLGVLVIYRTSDVGAPRPRHHLCFGPWHPASSLTRTKTTTTGRYHWSRCLASRRRMSALYRRRQRHQAGVWQHWTRRSKRSWPTTHRKTLWKISGRQRPKRRSWRTCCGSESSNAWRARSGRRSGRECELRLVLLFSGLPPAHATLHCGPSIKLTSQQ
jgi:hypothetical protein